MSAERLVKYRFFVAWADQKEERWLERMAAAGWHLVSGGIRFVFEKGEPQQMRYRLDYRPSYPQGQDEYFALFRDAGWEHAGDYFNWHYFRSPASAGAPEIFTDSESRAAKYRGLFVILMLAALINILTMPGIFDRVFGDHPTSFARVTFGVQLAMVLFIVYGAVRLGMLIWQIRHPRDTA